MCKHTHTPCTSSHKKVHLYFFLIYNNTSFSYWLAWEISLDYLNFRSVSVGFIWICHMECYVWYSDVCDFQSSTWVVSLFTSCSSWDLNDSEKQKQQCGSLGYQVPVPHHHVFLYWYFVEPQHQIKVTLSCFCCAGSFYSEFLLLFWNLHNYYYYLLS